MDRQIAAEEDSLQAWLGEGDLPVRIIEGPPSLSAVAITTGGGELVLR